MVVCRQTTLHCSAAPILMSSVQALRSSQLVGQGVAVFDSHVSGGTSTPSPQLFEQSLSLAKVHPVAQHPSPLLHARMGSISQTALHACALPESFTTRHALSDVQVAAVGHWLIGSQ